MEVVTAVTSDYDYGYDGFSFASTSWSAWSATPTRTSRAGTGATRCSFRRCSPSSSRQSSTSIRTRKASSPTSSAAPMPISPPASKPRNGYLPRNDSPTRSATG